MSFLHYPILSDERGLRRKEIGKLQPRSIGSQLTFFRKSRAESPGTFAAVGACRENEILSSPKRANWRLGRLLWPKLYSLGKGTALVLAILWQLLHWPGQTALAAVPRFGLDQQNSRQIQDFAADMNLPFQEIWQKSLGAPVESQPLLCNGSIYVQAGDRLYRLDLSGEILAVSPKLTESPLASGSSPTFSYTAFGPRIYQATRDHRLWALEPETLEPLWQEPGYLILSAGGRPELRYRVTSSPLVVNREGRSLLAVGTANGDQTGLKGQFGDNGFFLLEDLGSRPQVLYCRRAKGEVTGSPIQMEELIIGTQNLGAAKGEKDLLLCYDLAAGREIADTASVPRGIPGSPAAEGDRFWLADGQGGLFCYRITPGPAFTLLWENKDARSSTNLNSPAVGSRYVYLPVRNYKNSGRGALLAIEKESGRTAALKTFDSQLAANVVYWQPPEYPAGYLLVYEASGLFRFLDGETLEAAPGFLEAEGVLSSQTRLAGAVPGQKVSDPVMTEGYLLLVDSTGTLHAYRGKGGEMPEKLADLALTELSAPGTTSQNKVETVQARAENHSPHLLKDCLLEWYEDGQLKHSQRLDFEPGETKEINWLWPGHSLAGAVRLEARILPPKGVADLNGENNRREHGMIIQGSSQVDCNVTKDQAAWDVVYQILTGYHKSSYTDCSGLPEEPCRTRSYTDYSRPIYRYETVGYQEALSAKVTISTGQSRLGEAGGQPAADTEGRGAWEIVPYARQNGLDPETITRAGAGFGLKVETMLESDWEQKIPKGAEPFGGSGKGNLEVTAEIYDTRGRFLQTLKLERTGEEKNQTASSTRYMETWQLPEVSHTYLDGKTRRIRRFFTAPDLPDGRLRILIKVSGAGLHDLYTCSLAQVELYGSIYDDIYNRIRGKGADT